MRITILIILILIILKSIPCFLSSKFLIILTLKVIIGNVIIKYVLNFIMFECIILCFRNLLTIFIIKSFFNKLRDFKIMRIKIMRILILIIFLILINLMRINSNNANLHYFTNCLLTMHRIWLQTPLLQCIA